MASAKKKAAKAVPSAAQVASAVKDNPYIQRLIDDADLRDSVRNAIDSGKSAYGRLMNGKAPHKALLEDKKLQRELRQTYDAAREAVERIQRGPKKRKGLRIGRVVVLAGVGGAAALAGSEKLRSKVLDTLFGAEEEFQYTPPSSGGGAATPSAPVSAA